MSAARVVITAESPGWALTAAQSATGYACSVIGCGDLEAGIERWLPPTETPDGRPGVAILAFGFDRPSMEQALIRRIGQCVLTCATTACYNGMPLIAGKNLKIGGNLRYFGDGWQQSKLLDGQRLLAHPRDGRRVRLRGLLRHRQGSRRRQLPPVGPDAEGGAVRGRTCRRGDPQGPRRDHAVSGGNRSFRFEDRQPIQEAEGEHERRLLSDAPRRRDVGAAGRSECGVRDRDRRAGSAGGRGGDGGRHPGGGGGAGDREGDGGELRRQAGAGASAIAGVAADEGNEFHR